MPPRLVESKDEFERDLIRSAHDDRPDPRAMNRMLNGLGVNIDRLPLPLGESSSTAAVGGTLGNALIAKWLIGGMAVGVTTVMGAQLASTALERPSPAAAAVHDSPSNVAVTPPVRSSPLLRPPTVVAAQSARTPPPALGDSRPSRLPSKVAPTPLRSEAAASVEPPVTEAIALQRPAARAPTLSEEMRLLDTARAALSTGQASEALSSLAKYDRSFPNGALQPEAAVLKVRALLAAGDRAAAEALARGVIERAPRSEHADAVRAALGVRTNP